MGQSKKIVISGNQTSIAAFMPKPCGNTQNDKTSTTESNLPFPAIQLYPIQPFSSEIRANIVRTHYHRVFLYYFLLTTFTEEFKTV